MHAEYGGKNAEKHPPQRLTDEINASIAVNNEYFATVKKHMDQIVEILTNNYYLIEPDDAEVFGKFLHHNVRGKTEFHESGGLKLPHDVFKKLGDVYSLDPDFAASVNRRFAEKKAEFGRLVR